MKVIPLGTAGFIPTKGKETISCLVIDGTTGILLDAGTGVRRLADPKIHDHLQGVEVLHVLLSHFHHDHTAGVTWLLRLWERKLQFHVPTPPLIEYDGRVIMETLTTLPLFSLNVKKWPNCADVTSFAGDELNIDGLQVKTIKQPHLGGSVGFRIGKFGFVTDTEPRERHVPFLRGCDLVFMDTMHDAEDFAKLGASEASPAQHGYSVGNAGVAKAANVKRFGLIHVDPLYSKKKILELVEEVRAVFQGVFIPEEGAVLDVE